ncbi:hypothetical protein GE09DRAFT_1053536 [Coniochaeta sp. 2T2.1]|nr:hypothetical protein GE09DRAFT_1053536 [Coniochaeta sp. 2T2.1]
MRGACYSMVSRAWSRRTGGERDSTGAGNVDSGTVPPLDRVELLSGTVVERPLELALTLPEGPALGTLLAPRVMEVGTDRELDGDGPAVVVNPLEGEDSEEGTGDCPPLSAGNPEVGNNDPVPDSVTAGSVLLCPEPVLGGAVVLDTGGTVGNAEELPLRGPVEVEGGRTDVVDSGADVGEGPVDVVSEAPKRVVLNKADDFEASAVEEELSPAVKDAVGSSAELSVHGM